MVVPFCPNLPKHVIDSTVTSVSEEVERTVTEKLTEEKVSDDDSSSSADEDDEDYTPTEEQTRAKRRGRTLKPMIQGAAPKQVSTRRSSRQNT